MIDFAALKEGQKIGLHELNFRADAIYDVTCEIISITPDYKNRGYDSVILKILSGTRLRDQAPYYLKGFEIECIFNYVPGQVGIYRHGHDNNSQICVLTLDHFSGE